MSALEPVRVERAQRSVAELEPHAEAAEVPPLPERDYEALRADIAARGLRTAIEVTSAGVVLDGRARLRACRELGHELITVDVVEPDNELEHILRAALHRRHLDASQRAALALKLVPFEDLRAQARERQQANLRHGAEVATLPPPVAQGRTRELVAKLAGTSPRTAQDVITVHEHDPQLYEQILRGDRKANTAASEVRQTLRDAELAAAAPPRPQGPFELVYADPPWRLPGSPTSSRAVENHYPTMPLDEIVALQVPATDNAVLYLWAVPSMLPEALQVIAAWGFSYRGEQVWVKHTIGLGAWNRNQHEPLLVGVRGDFKPPATDRRFSSVITAPRRRHSAKPEQVYAMLEHAYPHASKLELFARGTARPGWICWGNQSDGSEVGR